GVWEIDPAEGPVELEVAAEVCRVSGAFGLPYPVAESLAAGSGNAQHVLIAEAGPRIVSHLDLGLDTTAFTLRGDKCELTSADAVVPLGSQLAPFGCELAGEPAWSGRDPLAAARL